MSWPCPDCRAPFTFDHCCPKLRERLTDPRCTTDWPFLARLLSLELETARRAFQIEQSLRTEHTNRSNEGA